MIPRLRLALLSLAAVIVGGTLGYVVLGFDPLDALYQTVTTISTVGFREVQPLGAAGKIFTIVLIMVGVGSALYTFSVVLAVLIEGHLRQHLKRRRMERDIAQMRGHVIVCGWGRVGRASAQYLGATGRPVVVIDRDPTRLEGAEHATVLGDVTDDRVLEQAGVAHARALIAAPSTRSSSAPHPRAPSPARWTPSASRGASPTRRCSLRRSTPTRTTSTSACRLGR